jgi:hypothetical protein
VKISSRSFEVADMFDWLDEVNERMVRWWDGGPRLLFGRGRSTGWTWPGFPRTVDRSCTRIQLRTSQLELAAKMDYFASTVESLAKQASVSDHIGPLVPRARTDLNPPPLSPPRSLL